MCPRTSSSAAQTARRTARNTPVQAARSATYRRVARLDLVRVGTHDCGYDGVVRKSAPQNIERCLEDRDSDASDLLLGVPLYHRLQRLDQRDDTTLRLVREVARTHTHRAGAQLERAWAASRQRRPYRRVMVVPLGVASSHMPAPRWFFRFMYDRESTAWERQHDGPKHRETVERIADELANVVAPPGPVADLGCGPGAHALALARRGYDVVGVDGSSRMVEVARERAARDQVDATFDVHDVSAPLRFADASLGGVLAILVVQHLPQPAAFIAEIRRCLRPGGHLLIIAPVRDRTSSASQSLYWRLRAACFQRVPGAVRFYDTNSLPRLVEDRGLTLVECRREQNRVIVLAHA